MDTLVRLQADELDITLIDFIKKSFRGKRIAVHVYEEPMDETEYLLSDPVHREKILRTIKEVEDGTNLKTYSMENIKNLVNEEGL